MNKKDLLTRTIIDYSLLVIKVCEQLSKDPIGRVIAEQLLRSGTSIGANDHEAQGAQSKADFVAKVSISYKRSFGNRLLVKSYQQSRKIIEACR